MDLAEKIKSIIADAFASFLEEGKRIFVEDIVSIIPDLIGIGALAAGGFLMLMPLFNRSLLLPLGIFVGISGPLATFYLSMGV